MTVRRVAIETLYHGLYDGPHATPKPSEDGPVFLGIGNITEDGKLDLTDVRHIAEEDYSAWTKRVTPQPGDIVFTYEATLNRYAIIPEGFRGCLGRRTALIRPNPDAVNSRFLFFYLFCEDWRKTISENTLSGATVDRIPITRFPTFPVTLPERGVQNRIAAILSAYDDLIENNNRRIKILEDMAQMLYREWFINFRFPGHLKVRMVESELGRIPNGWTVTCLETVCKRITDGSHWSPPTVESTHRMASSKDMYRWGLDLATARTISKEDFDSLVHNDCKPLAGDVLITKDGANYLKYCFVVERDVEAVLLSSVAMVRPDSKSIQPHFLAFHLSDPAVKARLAGRVSGAAIPRIVLKDFRQFKVMVPSSSVQDAFERLVGPMVGLCWRLVDKNLNLRTTRDLLLPKLISGEIPIDAAAERVEQSV